MRSFSVLVFFLVSFGVFAATFEEELKKLGLSPDEIIKVKEEAGNLSPNKVTDFSKWAIKNGVPDHEVKNIIYRSPRILRNGIESSLNAKINWLKKQGATESEVTKIIIDYPQIFGHGIDTQYEPLLKWLIAHGLPKGTVGKTLARAPELIGKNIQGNLDPKIKWFLNHGVETENIRRIIASYPQAFGLDIQNTYNPFYKWLIKRKVPIEKIGSVLTNQPQLLGLSLTENLDQKIEWLRSEGISRKQIGIMVGNAPQVLGYNLEDNMKPKWEYLKLKFALSDKDLFKNPLILGASYARVKEIVDWCEKEKVDILELPLSVRLRIVARVAMSNVEDNLKTLKDELDLIIPNRKQRAKAHDALVEGLQNAGKIAVVLNKYPNDSIVPTRMKECIPVLEAIAKSH